MPAPLIPKLKIPLTMTGGEFATVEQGTLDEVAQCVYAIIATPLGSRIDDMRFGVEPLEFEQMPVDAAELVSQVNAYEPAASVTSGQEIEEFSARVTLEVEISHGD